jgi:hypothetical protein
MRLRPVVLIADDTLDHLDLYDLAPADRYTVLRARSGVEAFQTRRTACAGAASHLRRCRGLRDRAARTFSHVSKPSSPGIITSSTIASGCSAVAIRVDTLRACRGLREAESRLNGDS